MKNTTLLFLIILFTGLITQACYTTNIQTGGTQYTGSQPQKSAQLNKSNDPETSFFNSMSSKDNAFHEKEKEPIEKTTTEPKIISQTSTRSIQEKQDTAVIDRESIQKQDLSEKKKDEVNDYDIKAIAVDQPKAKENGYNLNGVASWYGRDFDGKPTASGVIYDSRKLTAAHKKIPLGSIALIKNLQNDKEVLVTINDRGPFVKGRILDVSEYGSELLGFKEQGLTDVEIKIIRLGKGKVSNKGSTFDFFGSDPVNEKSIGAGDDSRANKKIDEMLDQEEKKHTPSAKLPTIKNESYQKGYAVQIGVFTDKRNALQLKKYIQSMPNHTHPINIFSRGSLYVVKVGSFTSTEQASVVKIKLIEEGYRAFVSAPQ